MAGAASEAFAQLEEIIVTTRKRAESLQEVPIVVTAITAETLQRKGIADLADITKYSTGLVLDEGFSKQDTRVIIRGLAPTRGRQNVAFLQDDIDISSEAVNTAGGSFVVNPRLFDIERVEVVKGPHSALYGRSAFNGAINYITKKPRQEFEGSFSADVGTYGKYEAKGSVSGPIVEDVLAAGITASGWNFDGFYRNSVTGAKIGGGNGAGVAGTAVLTPNDVLKFTGRLEYSEDDFDPDARTFITESTTINLPTTATTVQPGFTQTVTGTTTSRIVAGNIGDRDQHLPSRLSRNPRTGEDYPGSNRDIFRAMLRSEADFGGISLLSLSLYSDADSEQFHDQLGQGDATSPTVNALQEIHFVSNSKLISQDLRLQSDDEESAFKWLAGGLFWNEVTRHSNQGATCLSASGTCATILNQIDAFGAANPATFPARWVRDTHHYSVYGMLEYKFTDALSISTEVRHTWEAETVHGPGAAATSVGCTSPLRVPGPNGTALCSPPTFTVTPTATNYVGSRIAGEFWSPRLTIDYKVTPEAMVYAAVAQAKKPGGTTTLNTSGLLSVGGTLEPQIYLPEKMLVYELGLKSDWLDNTLQINAAGFYQDFSDKQVPSTIITTAGLPQSGVTNIGARVWGLEVDTAYAFTDELTGTLGYTFLDPKYSEGIISSSAGNIALAGNCTPVTLPGAARPQCFLDLSGNQMENAPKHSLILGGQFKQPIGADLDWFVEADARYQSKRFTDFYNRSFFDAYWNIDMRTGFSADVWEVTAYVNNLLDDDTIKTGIQSSNFNTGFIGSPTLNNGFLANLPDRRQFGVRANYRF
jgi:outer membrane receptor protein involved in Fe transport